MGNGPFSEPELRRLLEHEAWIRRLARSLVADENRVNELIQHVLTEALKNPPRNPKPWITVVMRAAAWRMLRSESRRKRRENAVARKEAQIPGVPHADQSETRERLVRLVREMEPSYREVLLMHYFEDLTLEEIARRKGVPSATMRTRLRRALAQLREKLRAHYGDPSRWVFALVPLSGIRRLSELGEGAAAAKTKAASAVGAKTLSTKAMLGAAAMVLSASSAVLLASLGSSAGEGASDLVSAISSPSEPRQSAARSAIAEGVAPEGAKLSSRASSAAPAAGSAAPQAPQAQESALNEPAPPTDIALEASPVPLATKDGSAADPSDGAIPIPPGSGGNWSDKKKNGLQTAGKIPPGQALNQGKKGGKKKQQP